ncbi:hypothetical protein [Thauera sp. SDU_THAU2]|uniref:hypothetical protein n=1 Tax=Thauera sp. SDU_THAU2 TaxID=3136633 RepID=UPI00311F8289
MIADSKIAFRLALRHRFLVMAAWLLILMLATGWMAAQFSGRQPATVALDMGLAVMRLGLPVLGLLMLQELLAREFERRFFLSSLTYPRTRARFLLGRLLAIVTLLGLLTAVLGLALAGGVHWLSLDYEQATPVALGSPYLFTLALMLVDLCVVLALGTVLAVVVATPSFVLIGGLGFMLLARSYSNIMALLREDSSLVSDARTYHNSLGLLGYLLPDLAVLDVRQIALYGQWSLLQTHWAIQAGIALLYALAMLVLAQWLLSRRHFA